MTTLETKHPSPAATDVMVCHSSSVIHGLLLLFLGLIAAALPAGSAADWPMFRGSASLTGVSNAELPAALKLRWSFQAKDSIESSAALVAGKAYFGSMDGSLYAVDL